MTTIRITLVLFREEAEENMTGKITACQNCYLVPLRAKFWAENKIMVPFR